MSTLEDRLRETLTEMADEARPVAMLPRLQHTQIRHRTQRRTIQVAAIAGAIIAAVVAGSLVVLRAGNPRIIEPVDRPPKVIRVIGEETSAPGRAELLLVLADQSVQGAVHNTPAFAAGPGTGRAVLVEESDTMSTGTFQLSLDGNFVARTSSSRTELSPLDDLQILDLRTGETNDLHGALGSCPTLSPDNSTVAALGESKTSLIDVATGRRHVVSSYSPEKAEQRCVGLGWAPDSRRLFVSDDAAGTLIIDRAGHRLAQLPGSLSPVNGSMSWSPDGRSILGYDSRASRFVTWQVDDRSRQMLKTPREATRAVGWAGTRIVWLVGQPGAERLVTTDMRGQDARLWTRLETNGMPVQGVSWSRALAGTAR